MMRFHQSIIVCWAITIALLWSTVIVVVVVSETDAERHALYTFYRESTRSGVFPWLPSCSIGGWLDLEHASEPPDTFCNTD